MLFLDLDGTVLNNRRNISDENKQAVQKVLSMGIAVVVCSGRIYNGARVYAKELGVSGHIIACNGAEIRTLPQGELVYLNPLETGDCINVLENCKTNGIYVHAYVGEVLVTEELQYTSQIYWEWNKNLPEEDRIDIKVAGDLKAYIRESQLPVSKLVVIGEHSSLLKSAREEISKIDTVETSSSSFDNFEVVNRGVNKGKALEILCSHMGVPVSETAAMGDNENDITLLKTAGFGIAMGNAVPALKEAADYITDTNENNGVAKAIKKLFM